MEKKLSVPEIRRGMETEKELIRKYKEEFGIKSQGEFKETKELAEILHSFMCRERECRFGLNGDCLRGEEAQYMKKAAEVKKYAVKNGLDIDKLVCFLEKIYK